MGPNTQSRRTEALDKFVERSQTDLSIKTARTLIARDGVNFDDHRVDDPDSSVFRAKEEVEILSSQTNGVKRIIEELNNVRDQLLSAGCNSVEEGNLVTLEAPDDEEKKITYLIVPNGSGNRIILNDGTPVTCVSPEAPLAQSLTGMEVGDELDMIIGGVNQEKAMAIVTIE